MTYSIIDMLYVNDKSQLTHEHIRLNSTQRDD